MACLLVGSWWLFWGSFGNVDFPCFPQGGRNFLLTRHGFWRGGELAMQLPVDPSSTERIGFMAPIGVTPDLVFATGRRILALPLHPELLEEQIREYSVQYLVTTANLLTLTGQSGYDRATSRLTSCYIQAHPERFEPVGTVHETYPDNYFPVTFCIYRVRNLRNEMFGTGKSSEP